MSTTEILGFLTGALSVIFAVRESAWTWPVGIANNVFFFILFWHSKLYGDAVLQIVYFVISVYGWWLWLYGGAEHSELPIARATKLMGVVLCTVAAIGTAAIYLLLRRFTDSNIPFGDAVTTALSLVAQFMLGRKLIENWAVWITADIVYVALYSYKGLYLTAILYAVFIAMCVAGYLHWRKSLLPQSRLNEAEA